MNSSRRNFLKKSCMSGACMCGFLSAGKLVNAEEQNTNSNTELMQAWISSLLENINEQEESHNCRTIMKKCACIHYSHLNMNEMLKPFVGNLSGFTEFLEKEWGWKITHKKEVGEIVANENKNYCVCPMVNSSKGVKSSILCYCSEGFAELMFSRVIGRKVSAEVTSSIHYGDETCIYKVKY